MVKVISPSATCSWILILEQYSK